MTASSCFTKYSIDITLKLLIFEGKILSIHLASQSGNKSKYNEKIDAFVPDKSKQQENTIGSANGIFTLEKTIKDAFDKGFDVSNKITEKNNKVSVPTVVEKKSTDHDKFW